MAKGGEGGISFHKEEIQAVLLQAAAFIGVPAGIEAFSGTVSIAALFLAGLGLAASTLAGLSAAGCSPGSLLAPPAPRARPSSAVRRADGDLAEPRIISSVGGVLRASRPDVYLDPKNPAWPAETALEVVGEISISARQINYLCNEIGGEMAEQLDQRLRRGRRPVRAPSFQAQNPLVERIGKDAFNTVSDLRAAVDGKAYRVITRGRAMRMPFVERVASLDATPRHLAFDATGSGCVLGR